MRGREREEGGREKEGGRRREGERGREGGRQREREERDGSPHHVIVIDVDRDILKLIRNVKIVLFSPKWLQRLKRGGRPVCARWTYMCIVI